jgi:phosphate/sulfate permease
MWFGFSLAGYSAIANDSIQTIGTFIASNAHRKWWHLWLFMGIIFIGTVTYSWVIYNGDVSYQRLTEKGFSEAPQTFGFLQLCAPIALLILTRMRIPVSTTFLLLNVFATDANAMFSILQKSLYGYLIAFLLAILVWYLTARFVDRHFKDKPGLGWTVLQWITSGLLWSVWLMQDASNIAVFLPRKLDV